MLTHPFEPASIMTSFGYVEKLISLLVRYEQKKQLAKSLFKVEVDSIVDELFAMVLEELINALQDEKNQHPTEGNEDLSSKQSNIELIDLSSDDDQASSQHAILNAQNGQANSTNPIKANNATSRISTNRPRNTEISHNSSFVDLESNESNSESDSDSDVVCLSECPSTSHAISKVNKAPAPASSNITPSNQTIRQSTPIDEDILQRELNLNKAMVCIFVNENKYLLCDIEQHRSKRNTIRYKIYNIALGRHFKTFHKTSEFIKFLIAPSRADKLLQSDQRILVAWMSNDDHLKPATVVEIYNDHKKVEVLLDSGERGLIPLEDVCAVDIDIPRILSPPPHNNADESIQFHDVSVMEKFCKRYSKSKPEGPVQGNLDGIWRWSEQLSDTDVETVYKGVWKNFHAHFQVNDNVQIWHDYSDDSNDNPSFPIFGKIMKLYEDKITNEKKVDFYWYIHPSEKKNCQLKPLKGALFQSSEWTTVDVDFLLGKVTILKYCNFAAAHPNHDYLVTNIRKYRNSLVKQPYQIYFNVGSFDHTHERFIFDVTLLQRADREAFFTNAENGTGTKRKTFDK